MITFGESARYIMMTEPEHRRPVRSYVRREGRLTPGQKKALTDLWPQFGIDLHNQTLDFSNVFGNDNPVTLEIGFGNGESLALSAQQNPHRNFLGIEVHRPGIGHLLLKLDKSGIENVRLLNHDAMEVLSSNIPKNSLQAIWLFFPDPWPKKKHHKRRIVNQRFLDLLANILADNGLLHIATDWQDYAKDMASTLEKDKRFATVPHPENLGDIFIPRPCTRFEHRGHSKGHTIVDLFYCLPPCKQK